MRWVPLFLWGLCACSGAQSLGTPSAEVVTLPSTPPTCSQAELEAIVVPNAALEVVRYTLLAEDRFEESEEFTVPCPNDSEDECERRARVRASESFPNGFAIDVQVAGDDVGVLL